VSVPELIPSLTRKITFLASPACRFDITPAPPAPDPALDPVIPDPATPVPIAPAVSNPVFKNSRRETFFPFFMVIEWVEKLLNEYLKIRIFPLKRE
jgi:hypothetical protein